MQRTLDGFTWVPNDRNEGSTYQGNNAWRIVLHTTEGAQVSASYISGHRYPPHLWYDPVTRAKYQTVYLDRGAFALEQYSWQNVYTNRGYALQVEIVGFASHEWPEWKLRNIAEDVIVPLVKAIQATGAKFNFDNVPPIGPIGGSASPDAPQRLSEAAWIVLDGGCSHRHVPGNEHWDTGNMNLQRAFAIAKELMEGGGGIVVSDAKKGIIDMASAEDYKRPGGFYDRPTPTTGLGTCDAYDLPRVPTGYVATVQLVSPSQTPVNAVPYYSTGRGEALLVSWGNERSFPGNGRGMTICVPLDVDVRFSITPA